MRRACLQRTHMSADIQCEGTCRPLGTQTILSARGTQRIAKRTGRHPKWKRLGKVCGAPDRGALGTGVLLGVAPSGPASSISLWAACKGADPRAPPPDFIVGRLCWGWALIKLPEHNLRFPSPLWGRGKKRKSGHQIHFFLLFWTSSKNNHKRNKVNSRGLREFGKACRTA